MKLRSTHTRRDFILSGTIAGGGLVFAGLSAIALAEKNQGGQQRKEKEEEQEISPAEDLMREHGILERIMLIFEESAQRLNENRELNLTALIGAAKIVRVFIEDYHSKLEEDHVFPRFEKAGKHAELVKSLREQHQAGRLLTDQIQQLAVPKMMVEEANYQKLGIALKQFIRMYRPHLAREDTVLFPAIRSIMTPEEYDAMGDRFEDREHELFGENGFENVVEQVAGLEKMLGIYDLSKFTPD